MSNLINAYIDDILTAKGNEGGGIFMTDGAYLLAVRKLTVEKSGKTSAVFLKGDLHVISSRPIFVPFDLRRKDEPDPLPNPEGSDLFRAFDIGSKPGQNDAKSFLAAVAGITLQQADADQSRFKTLILQAVASDQPFKGRVVDCQTYRTITKTGKNQGQPFIGQNWRPVQCSPEEIAAVRAELDKPVAIRK
jgi:hypothetical protein